MGVAVLLFFFQLTIQTKQHRRHFGALFFLSGTTHAGQYCQKMEIRSYLAFGLGEGFPIRAVSSDHSVPALPGRGQLQKEPLG